MSIDLTRFLIEYEILKKQIANFFVPYVGAIKDVNIGQNDYLGENVTLTDVTNGTGVKLYLKSVSNNFGGYFYPEISSSVGFTIIKGGVLMKDVPSIAAPAYLGFTDETETYNSRIYQGVNGIIGEDGYLYYFADQLNHSFNGNIHLADSLKLYQGTSDEVYMDFTAANVWEFKQGTYNVNFSDAVRGTNGIGIGKAFSDHGGYANVLDLLGGLTMQKQADADYLYMLNGFQANGTLLGRIYFDNLQLANLYIRNESQDMDIFFYWNDGGVASFSKMDASASLWNFRDASIQLFDDKDINLGTGLDTNIRFSSAQTNDCTIIQLDSTSKSILIAPDRTIDYSHATQSNPTLFIHSATTGAGRTTQWVSLTHDATDGVITAGAGDLSLAPAGNVKFGTHSSIGAETVTGYIAIKDSAGNSRKLAVVS